ncbi:putative toxin-antitoxin system toxin component, PIN family [Pseudoduganella chitinolytica]|uniref:Toxin-antitoxin system toxin component, PIN family n=1 Tax=Pseudoduganella chitinolytica TaxID=34070 RepID=A0ABY8BKH2_9BURK|nr:putative toxin-antitoxin system toxin component, PIN family [Pseudoduganella chitinolytica]WEF34764.1 putative toxin-antitoxin system toxin component, PIN family [Pseudoduganella chitinolytica]
MIPPSSPALPERVVIDTNVCLDLFVFHDPRWAGLLAAIESGAVEAITRADCRDEYNIVLHYPHLPLDDGSRPVAAARFDALIKVVEAPVSGTRLPVCTDPDDQKFLELARDADAHTLISKDKALLKLAKRLQKAGLFRVIPPEKWALAGSALPGA